MKQHKNKKYFLAIAALLILSMSISLSGCLPPIPGVIDVTGVDITEEDQSIKVGNTLQLTVVVSPEDATNKDITWESDNPDVATVTEDGLVTALSSGVANITVTTVDGSFTDTIKITVIKPTPVPSPTPTPTPKIYTLYLEAKPEEGGTTTGDGDYEEGTQVNITATPANGYEFDRWETLAPGVLADDKNSNTTFTMANSDATIWAQFTLKTYEITFEIVEEIGVVPAGISSRDITSPVPVEGVDIEIFSDEEKTEKIDETTTGQDGKATVELPNGEYWFTASKKGYENYPPENNVLSVQRPLLLVQGYFEVDGADVTIPPIQMNKVQELSCGPVWHTADQKTDKGTGSTSSPISIAVPDNISEGDLIIVIIGTQNNSGLNTSGIIDYQSAGFSIIDYIHGNKTGTTVVERPEMAAFYKIATDSEPGSYQFYLDHSTDWYAIAGRVTGHNTTNPIGQSSTMVSNGQNFYLTGFSGTPCSLLVAAAVVRAPVELSAERPTEMTEIYNDSSTNLAFKVATENILTDGDTGSRQFSVSSAEHFAGLMFEILPELSE